MAPPWTVILEPSDNRWWVATIVEFPGAVSQGKTPEEAREMVLEALGELLEIRALSQS